MLWPAYIWNPMLAHLGVRFGVGDSVSWPAERRAAADTGIPPELWVAGEYLAVDLWQDALPKAAGTVTQIWGASSRHRPDAGGVWRPYGAWDLVPLTSGGPRRMAEPDEVNAIGEIGILALLDIAPGQGPDVAG